MPLRCTNTDAECFSRNAAPAGNSPTSQAASGATIHHNVACDICGCNPVVGIRHKSLLKSDYDVCGRCVGSPAAAQFGPYLTLGSAGSSNSNSDAAGNSRGCGGASGSSNNIGSGRGLEDGVERQQQQPAAVAASGEDGGRGGQGAGVNAFQTMMEAGRDRNSNGAGARGSSSGSGGSGRGRGKGRGSGGRGDGGNGRLSNRHQALVQWVWRYYSNTAGEAAAATAGGGRGGGETADGGGGVGDHGLPSSSSRSGGDGGSGGGRGAGQGGVTVYVTDRPPLYLQHEGHSR